MPKPSQEKIDAMTVYFDTNGRELSQKEGELLPLDQKMLNRDPQDRWSIDVIVMTKDGVCSAYYRHENKTFTVKAFLPFDLFMNDPLVGLLSQKFLISTSKIIADLTEIVNE